MRQLLLVWLAVVAVSHSLDDDQVFQSSKESATQLNQNALNDRALGVNVGDGSAQSEPAERSGEEESAKCPSYIKVQLAGPTNIPRPLCDGSCHLKCPPSFIPEASAVYKVRGCSAAPLFVSQLECKCASGCGCSANGAENVAYVASFWSNMSGNDGVRVTESAYDAFMKTREQNGKRIGTDACLVDVGKDKMSDACPVVFKRLQQFKEFIDAGHTPEEMTRDAKEIRSKAEKNVDLHALLGEDKKKAAAPKDKKKAAAPKDNKKSAAPKDKKKAAAPKDNTKSAAPKDKKKAAARKIDLRALVASSKGVDGACDDKDRVWAEIENSRTNATWAAPSNYVDAFDEPSTKERLYELLERYLNTVWMPGFMNRGWVTRISSSGLKRPVWRHYGVTATISSRGELNCCRPLPNGQ